MDILLLKSFNQLPKFASYFLAVDRIFRSTENSQKIWSTDYESFDQLKTLKKFGQLIMKVLIN